MVVEGGRHLDLSGGRGVEVAGVAFPVIFARLKRKRVEELQSL